MDERAMFVAAVAVRARRLHKTDPRVLAELTKNMPDAQVAVSFITELLANLAARGDSRAAIHLDERMHGRVKYSLEHAGPPTGPGGQAGPISVLITREDGHTNGNGRSGGDD